MTASPAAITPAAIFLTITGSAPAISRSARCQASGSTRGIRLSKTHMKASARMMTFMSYFF